MSKTIEEIKDECAKDFGFNNYGDVEDWNSECMIIDEVAERYAKSQTQELIEQNRELVELVQRCWAVIHAYNNFNATGTGNEILKAIQEMLTKYDNIK